MFYATTHQAFRRSGIALLFALSTICFCAVGFPVFAKGELSAKQARKLIAGMPGIGLKTESVHVNSVRSIDSATAQATAELAMAFRVEKDDSHWSVVEFRVGQEQWESVDLLMRALKVEGSNSPCETPELAGGKKADPTNRQVRCLLAQLLGVQLPSDAVRIKDISKFGLPLGSKASALVEAVITAEFQFTRTEKGPWRVSGARTGTHSWVEPESVYNALNAEKSLTARAELARLAKALEDFHDQRGYYVESKSGRELVDFLSPRHLERVIRLDPWRHPYLYEGTRTSFSLRSLGPDGKENTSDDIVLSGPARG